MKERPTDVPGIFKTSEGVLINKDNDALKAYKIRKIKENKINIRTVIKLAASHFTKRGKAIAARCTCNFIFC